MNRKPVLLLCLFWIVAACEYEPRGIYEREISDDATPPIIEVVNLDWSEESDTIELLYNRVYFHFKSSDQQIIYVSFYLNGTLLGAVESENGYYDLNHHFLYEGYHKLRLEVYTHSGTGSIADSLGIETFQFQSKEWVIRVLDSDYSKVTTGSQDGFLKLRWPDPGPFEEIPEYIVYRSGYELGRTSDLEFIDKGYVGEGGYYSVNYIDDLSGTEQTYGRVEIPKEIKIEFTADKFNNYHIDWGVPKYYAAIDSTILFSYGKEANNFSEPPTKEIIADVHSQKFLLDEDLFGAENTYWLKFTPKFYNPIYEKHKDPGYWYIFSGSDRIKPLIGYPSPKFKYLGRINSSEFIYHADEYDSGYAEDDSVFRYCTIEDQNLSSYRYNPPDYSRSGDHYRNLSTSPDGQYFTATIGWTGTIMHGSTTDFSDYYILKDDNIINLDFSSETPISNIGTGIICSSGKKTLYDFKNDRLINTIEDPDKHKGSDISFDGRYFCLNKSSGLYLYSIKNDKIIQERYISYPKLYIDFFKFHQAEPDKAVTWGEESGTFSIVGCPGMEVLKSFPLPEESILDIDFTSDRILSYSKYLLVIRDLNNGELLYEIPVGFSSTFGLEFKLIGNSIFINEGIRYLLD